MPAAFSLSATCNQKYDLCKFKQTIHGICLPMMRRVHKIASKLPNGKSTPGANQVHPLDLDQ